MLSGLLSGDLPPNFSGHTLDKATKAKLTLENYYNNLISQQRERRERMRRMEVFYWIKKYFSYFEQKYLKPMT